MTDLPSTPVETAMSARTRRRVTFAVLGLVVLLFVGGMVAFLVDFRHQTVCPDGAQWISKTEQFGRVTFTCPGGQTVTQGGIVP